MRLNAVKDVKRNAAVVYVMTAEDDLAEPQTIVGYYSLSASSVLLHDLPQGVQRKMANYEKVSATLVGRLAVNTKFVGQGLGAELLRHALLTCLEQSRHVASAAIIVDALDEQAAGFYRKYGFMPMNSPLKLCMSMATVASSG